jgi:hypothetical protein
MALEARAEMPKGQPKETPLERVKKLHAEYKASGKFERRKQASQVTDKLIADFTRTQDNLETLSPEDKETMLKLYQEGFELLKTDVQELREVQPTIETAAETPGDAEFDSWLDQAIRRVQNPKPLERVRELHETYKTSGEFDRRKAEKLQKELEEKWFAGGEATQKVGDEEMRLVEIRENLGLEPEELKQIEQTFETASKREMRDMSLTLSRALPEKELKELPDYREAAETAAKLAKIEDEIMDLYNIDLAKEKTSLIHKFKNRLMAGVLRAAPAFRKKYAEYEKLQTDYNAKMKKLEEGGVFAGKSRMSRLLDRRLREFFDQVRVKGVRGR